MQEDGDQGALFRPERLRGSLQTWQAAELLQREPLKGKKRCLREGAPLWDLKREAGIGDRNREVKNSPREALRGRKAVEDLDASDHGCQVLEWKAA